METTCMYPPCAVEQANTSAFGTEFKTETKLSSCRFETDPLAVHPHDSKDDIKPVIGDSVRAATEFSIRSILSEKIEIKDDVHIKRNCPSTDNFSQGVRTASSPALLATCNGQIPGSSYPSLGQLLTCNVCNKSFSFVWELQTHQCTDTQEHSPSVDALLLNSVVPNCAPSQQKHAASVTTKHTGEDKTHSVHEVPHPEGEMFVCDMCGHRCDCRDTLEAHLLSHTSRRHFACFLCNKTFRSRHSLVYHERTVHNGNTSVHACSTCNRTFKQFIKLKRHERSGCGQNITCNICDKSFLFWNTLRVHKRNLHSDERRTYPSPYCDQALLSKYSLDNHVVRHTGEAPYSCDDCGNKYRTSALLNHHRNTSHSAERAFSCHICALKFKTVGHLNAHLFRHTGERPFTCADCNQTFVRKWDLVDHQKRVHKVVQNVGTPAHTCSKCSRTFKQLHKLQHHERSGCGGRPRPSCDACGKCFVSRNTLRVHKRNIHSGRRPRYPCPYCDQVLSSKVTLGAHVVRHTGEAPYSCDDCGNKYLTSARLNHHRNTSHSDERAFVCDICGQKFKTVGHLNTHLFLHTGERPFTCADCNQTFVRKWDLVQHQKNIHKLVESSGKNKNTPVHTCSKCSRTFKRLYDLNNHKICEKGKRMFKCEICELLFTRQESVTRHMGVHTGERPFTCEVCDRSFRGKYDFCQHQLTHAGDDRLHTCPLCNKSFTRLRSLKQHRQKSHS